MNLLQQRLFRFQEKIKPVHSIDWKEVLKQWIAGDWRERASGNTSEIIKDARQKINHLRQAVKEIGASPTMDEYEKRKLGIFNQINFFQLVTGVFIPLIGLVHNNKFPPWAWLVASLPAIISILVLWLNAKQQYEAGIILYFICYPVMTSIVYMSGINVGAELSFVLYGILSVFFIQEISHMLFSLSLSMISYFMLAVVWKDHRFQLESANMFLYLFNQFAGIVFIFYGLFLIKKENMDYQASVLAKNRQIAEDGILLQQQTVELTELNSVKNKLFSVIAHDLKTPMYSLRNLFSTIQQQKSPAKEIKALLPDMINNLNYTTGLMDNLLQWAKCQMQSQGVKTQLLDITKMITEVVQLLQLQAQAKELTIKTEIDNSVFVSCDKDMIDLVLRNLLSNAIKFTPPNGTIVMGVNGMHGAAEIYVTDSGQGIGPGALEKIKGNDYYTTNGTAQEPGTGLGLMLCKEFLLKNNSQLFIQSERGRGSTFSFSLPVLA